MNFKGVLIFLFLYQGVFVFSEVLYAFRFNEGGVAKAILISVNPDTCLDPMNVLQWTSYNFDQNTNGCYTTFDSKFTATVSIRSPNLNPIINCAANTFNVDFFYETNNCTGNKTTYSDTACITNQPGLNFGDTNLNYSWSSSCSSTLSNPSLYETAVILSLNINSVSKQIILGTENCPATPVYDYYSSPYVITSELKLIFNNSIDCYTSDTVGLTFRGNIIDCTNGNLDFEMYETGENDIPCNINNLSKKFSGYGCQINELDFATNYITAFCLLNATKSYSASNDNPISIIAIIGIGTGSGILLLTIVTVIIIYIYRKK